VVTESNAGYRQRLAELDAMVAGARLSPEATCERAAGLLAGRIGCRIDEAHAHLRLLAGQQRKSLDRVAAEMIAALETRRSTPPQQLLRTAREALRSHRAEAEPIEAGLLGGWIRHDEPSRLTERLAQTERLGNLGWGEWDLLTDDTYWSEGLYQIYERDPADGPLPREESDALGVPEDEPLRRQAMEAFGRGETIDLTARARIHDKIKHLRAVVDAVRDADGRPVRIYGIIQDVTARETSRIKLAEVQQQLREHQQDLAAEHRLAAQLQNIVLPIPDAPIELPGLRAAVRYLPAEQAGRVGGDWYHAAPAGDGSIILAVGDVAGHGVQAASTMAQLRYALAALTVTATSQPAELLSHLNRLLYTTEPTAGTATAVIARYDPATRELIWAQAGHPAPLHARAGAVVELARPAGVLLGAVPGPIFQTATATLEADDILLLYTDGLIEHRSHTLEQGVRPVIALLNELTTQHHDHSLEEFLARLQRANPDDDTCVLAIRRLREAPAPEEADRM
jgi:serine phosphatase RsbU (regulator of sigma subunit)